MSSTTETKTKSKFSAQFWLVIMFEFFERGSYYGMMSFISVYFTDTLNIPKESVGVIKGVIQPLLYFLPILSGAIADRFGYRKMLMIAFTVMGGGYFLTSQMTTYTSVFIALVVMGFGAGLFKPIISGSIARLTDKSNSSMGFGIYYWSINLGAFLFPLILVPWLKSLNPSYVIIAAAICTSAMILPTAFFFKDPVKKEKNVEEKADFRQTMQNLIHTMANAFEIIYSPIVLIFNQLKKGGAKKALIILMLAALSVYSVLNYIDQPPASESYARFGIVKNGSTLIFSVDKNMSKRSDYLLKTGETNHLTIYKPLYLEKFASSLLEELKTIAGFEDINREELSNYISIAETPDKKLTLTFSKDTSLSESFEVTRDSDTNKFNVKLRNIAEYSQIKDALLKKMHEEPMLRAITLKNCESIKENLKSRSFFLLFICLVLIVGMIIVAVTKESAGGNSSGGRLPMSIITAIGFIIWVLPGLTMLVKIICFVIYISVTSLKIIDTKEEKKFVDHAKFLLMIFLYSGFWVLYFQMFDSVLWYVQAYVDAASLNSAVNSMLAFFSIEAQWFFDVEHVTVINAGTIILLQLIISKIVNKFKALPTMITGIAIATAGMALLAFSTDIWIFIAGITIFSIGEMTAHPKFISYIGLIAPAENKAMYMGYIFLYGVFGSAIGGVLGAKLYVYFIDTLNQPTTLWLVFSAIGVVTIISLLLYNKFLAPASEK